MSRENKFRAWYMPFGPKGAMQEMVHGKASSILAFAEMSPDKYIVEQFTGLKDSSGDDIYENDLVLLDPVDPPYQVIYDEGKFKLSNDNCLGLVYDLGEEDIHCKIFGNIHTRPKTIRGKMMKIKTFWTDCTEDDDFDSIVNKFIEGKKVVQISTGDTSQFQSHTLTVLYEETKHE